MDVERLLLSKCIAESRLQVPISRGIEPHHFVSRAVGTEPATADVWAFLLDHFRRYRAVISPDLFKKRWPGFVMIDSIDPFDAILDEFIKVVKRRAAIETIRILSDQVDDPKSVAEIDIHFMEAARELGRLVPTTEVHRFSDSLNRLELYNQREQLGFAPGISTMIQEIDDLTYGVQNYEMCVIQGMLNLGKSSMGIGMAAKSYFERDQTSLFLTLEMEGEKLANRWDAYAAGISYKAIKKLELEQDDKEKWEKIGEKASDTRLEKDIIVIDDMRNPNIERIFSEIERRQPDCVYVDPIDEVSAPSQYRSLYERQAYVARELKGIARALKIPMVVMAQSGRDAEAEGSKISNIAGSIDIARKADIVLGLHATEDMQKMKKMEIKILKIRDDEGKGRFFNYKWNPSTMEFRPWKPEDAVPVNA